MRLTKSLHVLIIDDDEDMCCYLRQLVQQIDRISVQCKIFSNPYDALLEMVKQEFDLVFVDINIPEISGPEILITMDQIIKNDRILQKSDLYQKKVPVILMSSSDRFLQNQYSLNNFIIEQRVLKKDIKHIIQQKIYSLENLNENSSTP